MNHVNVNFGLPIIVVANFLHVEDDPTVDYRNCWSSAVHV